jgi:hypothetical protein
LSARRSRCRRADRRETAVSHAANRRVPASVAGIVSAQAIEAMKNTTKKISFRRETLRNLAQQEIRDLADHELVADASRSIWSIRVRTCE